MGDNSPMPIYEYQCQKCHHHFEEIQKLSDPPVTQCPECSGSVNRLISQTSFALKGEGWYKDGYSRPSEKPAKPALAKPDKPAPAKSENKAAKSQN